MSIKRRSQLTNWHWIWFIFKFWF